MRVATDNVGQGLGQDPNDPTATVSYVSDQDIFNVYGSVSHRITTLLTGRLIGQYQYGRFNGEGYYDAPANTLEIDGSDENFFAVTAQLEYTINAFWSADLSYGWDRLDSYSASRSFTRQRVFGGVTAKY